MRYLIAVASLLLLCAALALVDAQQPTFRTGTTLVRTDVTVLDADHKMVRGLTRDDFRIVEDGVPQQIALFEPVDIPLAPLPERPIRAVAADTVSNADADRGRLVALILDDINTLRERADRVKDAARRVVARLQPDDYIWIAVVSGAPAGTRDLTRDRGAVLAAIDAFDPGKTRLDWGPDAIQMGTERKDVQWLHGLIHVAKRLAPIEGHGKAVIFVGEGVADYLPEAKDELAGALHRDLAESATRGAIRLYLLDPRGPTNMGAEGPVPDFCACMNFSPWSDEAQAAKASLELLAEETGGSSVVNATNFQAAADRLVADMNTSYSIGYYPTNTRADGKFRKVTIETTRRGLQVRAYSGYWAAKRSSSDEKRTPTRPVDPTAAALGRAVTGLVPVSSLGLRASAAAFRSTKPGMTSVVIPLEVDWPQQAIPVATASARDAVRLRLLVMDMKGKFHATEDRTANMRPHRVAGSANGDTVNRARDLTLVLLDVPPGRYVLRLAAHSALTDATGSLFLDVEAPNFAAPSASVSSLSLGISRPDVNARLAGLTRKLLLPVPPTPERDVSARDEVIGFLRAYEGSAATGDWRFRATLRSGRGDAVFGDDRTVKADASAWGTLYQVTLPMRTLSPGLYQLVVEAHTAVPIKSAGDFVRETSFRVR
jgi:VWFA-related protein